jgi:hypothetical protein
VVLVAVYFLRLPVLFQHSPENTQTPHPDDLKRQARIGCTLTLTETSVTTLCHGNITPVLAATRVHSIWLLENNFALNQLSDGLTSASYLDVGAFIGVQPERVIKWGGDRLWGNVR